jgi:hypothetical protein
VFTVEENEEMEKAARKVCEDWYGITGLRGRKVVLSSVLRLEYACIKVRVSWE